jgi:uracil-DNA glycosylase family 4
MTNDIPARMAARQQVLRCTSCGLRTVCTSPVPFTGPNPNYLAVIGEAPGAREDERGAPFVGPSGTLLRTTLDGLAGEGFSDELAYLNVVSCFPNRTPTRQEVEACRPNLVTQLSAITPYYCLLVGGVAVSSWFPGQRMGDIRGQFWHVDEAWTRTLPDGRHGAWMMATWHPAAILRQGIGSTRGKEWVADIERWVRVAVYGNKPDRGMT